MQIPSVCANAEEPIESMKVAWSLGPIVYDVLLLWCAAFLHVPRSLFLLYLEVTDTPTDVDNEVIHPVTEGMLPYAADE